MAAAKHAVQRIRVSSYDKQPAFSMDREFQSGVMSITNKDRSSVRPSDHVSIGGDEAAVTLCGGNIYNEVNNPHFKKIVTRVQENLAHSNVRVDSNKRRAHRIFAAMKM